MNNEKSVEELRAIATDGFNSLSDDMKDYALGSMTNMAIEKIVDAGHTISKEVGRVTDDPLMQVQVMVSSALCIIQDAQTILVQTATDACTDEELEETLESVHTHVMKSIKPKVAVTEMRRVLKEEEDRNDG